MLPNVDTIDFHSIKGLPIETLYSGLIATGVPGSGKTRTVLRPLLRSLLSLRRNDPDAKCGALIIDPKGYDLLPVIEATLERCGRQEDLVLIGAGPKERAFNPLETGLSSAQITNTIVAAASTFGQETTSRTRAGERFWESQDRAVMGALVALCRHAIALAGTNETLSFEHLHRCRALLNQPEQDLRKWATELVAEMGLDEGMPLIELATLPETTRHCITASVGSLLQPFASGRLKAVLQPEPSRPSVDLRNIFEEGKIVVISTAYAESALELLPAQVLIKSAFARLALSRRRWARNTSRPCWLVVDEGARSFTAHADSDASEANLMDMSRANRVGVIWASQNLSALMAFGNEHLVNHFAGLAGTHVFLANTCPACASLAARSLGTERRHDLHPTVNRTLPPPLLFPRDRGSLPDCSRGVLVPSEVPRVPAAALSRLRAGEMWIRLAHTGEVHHIQADVSAP